MDFRLVEKFIYSYVPWPIFNITDFEARVVPTRPGSCVWRSKGSTDKINHITGLRQRSNSKRFILKVKEYESFRSFNYVKTFLSLLSLSRRVRISLDG